ncbi:sugar ABC transporter ATPase [Anopheles sinensis]|uniref:Sugar ABC transporter ATPase n=1 Tax=Anopheles sinensis TaxID=74873 RepID=A0A084WTL2_ANOSI|nr:sugar ABC transporter ATPase [Anopheles sinensis]
MAQVTNLHGTVGAIFRLDRRLSSLTGRSNVQKKGTTSSPAPGRDGQFGG